jgi:hypothetical protein
MNRIALALTIAAISTTAAAQSNRKPTWDDLLKPYQAKTDPAVPVAPPKPAAVPVAPPAVVQPLETCCGNSWMDECVLTAAAQLLTATQFSRPLYPGEVRRIMHHCAAQSIWREK